MSGLLAFCGLAFVASITPGPTNLILLVQGMRNGVQACGGFIIGASAGAAGVLWAAALLAGLAAELAGSDGLTAAVAPVMSILAALWLSWLAWQICRSRDIDQSSADGATRLGWRSGAALQLVNPKTWGTALAVAAIYGIHADGAGSSILALVFFVITLPCLFGWALMGRWLASLQHWQWLFNPCLAGLLLITAWWPVLQLL